MNELKQILKWGTWSLFGLIALPLVISIVRGCGVKFRLLPYTSVAYLLILLAVIALLTICVVGSQRRLNQEKEYDLQKMALDDKSTRESAKLAYDKEERDRKWRLENEERSRKWKLEDEDRANAQK